MPEPAEPPSTGARGRAGKSGSAGPGATGRNGGPPPITPIEAVLFDFHGTLAQVEDAVIWVRAAAADCGTVLDIGSATVLADRLVTAGRAGGPLPARIPLHLIELWAERDLYEHAHRAAFTGLAATVDSPIDGLAEALYERMLSPGAWVPYPDAAPTLAALKSGGTRIAVVSNIGFDIRPVLVRHGLDEFVDAYVLSYEIGRCKPDPAIFEYACAKLHVEARQSLMVGDTPADAAATAIGCAAYVVAAAGPGEANGLGAVHALVAWTAARAGVPVAADSASPYEEPTASDA